MSITQTPLRYPGGKTVLSSYLKSLLTVNSLQGCHYAEPYAGGAGLALELLYSGFASEIHLNDLNPSVYNFWEIAVNHHAQLIELIQRTDVNIDEWHRQKSIYEQKGDGDQLAYAFATFFLNRTNRSGILHGGVIGGKGQIGNYKLDARYNKESLIEKVKKLGGHKTRIHLYNKDAAHLIKDTLPLLPKKSLTYFDPPYCVKGQNLYQNHYLPEDHAEIARLIQTSKIGHWMVSYDNVPDIARLYSERHSITYSLSYSAQNHIQGSEIIVFSDNLGIPDIQNPAKCRKIAKKMGYDSYTPPLPLVS